MKEEPYAGVAGHQGGIPIRFPSSDALPDGTSWPLRGLTESCPGHAVPPFV